MKTKKKIAKHLGIPTVAVIGLFLVSWSPTPTGTNIEMTGGIIGLKPTGGVSNVYGTAPNAAAVFGQANRIDASADANGNRAPTTGQGLVVGVGNKFGTITANDLKHYSAVIGEQNITSTRSSLIVGAFNNASILATAPFDTTATSFSAIVGHANTTINTENSLIVGKSNTVGSLSTPGTRVYHSAAIGSLNTVTSSYGWSVGYGNSVSSNFGVALGTGTTANMECGTALGKFNSDMEAGDVLVVGTGLTANNKKTSLTVREDGSVVLGNANSGNVVLTKAQGDISMGVYQ